MINLFPIYRTTLFTFVCILCLSCTDEWRRDKPLGQWSSSNPIEIPYNIRMKQFMKKNLVQNHSFEIGTLSEVKDSVTVQQIQHWKIIGDNVTYYTKANKNMEDSILVNTPPNGSKAVMIHRTKANETDTLGEGVMSNFIEVIPGNYDFHLKIKLQNIKPQFERLGTRMFDAIHIRLFYYDAKKNPVSPAMFYPYTSTYLDNSFKGYSFSNFHYIDELDWSSINARTYNYPFTEGDIPDGTKYVRIFIGLKGTGTMWIDDVNFSYSKWNFTTQERMKWYKDISFSAVDMLVPTPKFAQQHNEIILKKDNSIPVIVNNYKFNELSLHTEQFLKKHLEQVLYSDSAISTVEIVKKPDFNSIQDASVVFLLTHYNNIDIERFEDIEPDISQKPQSYVIFDSVIHDKTHIIIAACDAEGLFYGVTTLVRLLNKEKKTYQHATLVDYPDFIGRGYQLTPWKTDEDIQKDIEYLEYLTYYRFNKAYLPYYQSDDAKKWFAPSDMLLKGTKLISAYVSAHKTIQLGVMFNPYYHFPYEMHTSNMSDSLKYIFQHDEKGMEMIKRTLRPVFEQGATFLMFLADDFVPHSSDYRKIYALWTPEDIKRHTNLQNAQAYMVRSIHQWLKQYGDIRFELCPPWYLNEFIDKSRGHADAYFRDMQVLLPKDVIMIWTGNTVRSLSFDSADLKRYADLAGHHPMLWDNTLYARSLAGIYGGYPAHYPQRTYLCNLFEPYDVKMPENYYLSSPHMYTNGVPSTEIYKIKYATVADFQWNMSAYKPELSLWKVLVNHFGKAVAWKLIEFNTSYFALSGFCIQIEKDSTYSRKNISNIKKLSGQLKKSFENLSDDLQTINPALLSELEHLQKQLIERIDAIIAHDYKQTKDGKEQI